MRLRLLLLLLFFSFQFTASASHLAGGDFELQHVSGYNYRLFLNQYFDEINGNPGARDNLISVAVFDKATNREMMLVNMPFRSQTNLNYANIDCTTSDLRTSKIVYYQDIYLDPAVYTSPQGYYIVWERCCRNGKANNIVAPVDAAQTFYMEFPAVVRNGSFFKNSSPQLSPPLADYACLNELFAFDFSSVDPDGDELVYDMVTPLNGSSTSTNPVPRPSKAPHQEVMWLPGHDVTKQVTGSPPMTIDRNTGRLTLMPDRAGLFVFGVRYQEYRNGVKIGETRRDFQLLVKACPRNETPQIFALAANTKTPYKEGDVLRINPTDPRCLNIYFTDTDRNERLRIKTSPVNFTDDRFSLAGQTDGMINAGMLQDTLKATFCFDSCFDTEGNIYELDMIVSDFGDNGCGLPRQDTVRLSFVVAPEPDRPPVISYSAPGKVYEAREGESFKLDIVGTDPDNDELTISLLGKNFDLATQSITFGQATGTGRVASTLEWLIDCQALQQPSYQLEVTVKSNHCDVGTTETVEIRPKPTPVTGNTVAASQLVCFGSSAALTGGLITQGDDSHTFLWEMSTEADQGGYSAAPGVNNGQDYTTEALEQDTWFRRVVIFSECRRSPSEAVSVTVEPLPTEPTVTNALTCADHTATLTASPPTAGTLLQWYDQPTGGNLLYTGSSYETPPLSATTAYYVQAVNGNGCASATRATAVAEVLENPADAGEDTSIIRGRNIKLRGKGGLTYTWSPAIALSDPAVANPIASPQETTTYTLTVTTQEGCVFTDEVTVTVLPRIRPADALTLNGDNMNDTWYIENIAHYPQCNIQVFTRWGAKVYESNGYDTPWDGTYGGKELPMAAYYYIIQLNEREKPITGSITLIK